VSDAPTAEFRGRALARGADGYEEARRAAVWNARTPPRYPDLIVQAEAEADLVAAVRLARAEGMKIGVRSGGHSWAGNHVRDGGMLLDVSRLDAMSVDAEAMTATVGPGCSGNEVLAALGEQDLFFPAGHCPAWRWAGTCCRAVSAGTGGSMARPA
jgi:FAD/FMN-containing dehydrogenase